MTYDIGDNPGGRSFTAPREVADGWADKVVGYELRLNGRIVGKLNPGAEKMVEAIQHQLVNGKAVFVELVKGDLVVSTSA